ncbi:M10 family metallopeptidase C-terminal domain-containing protein [Ensifer soli]|uniref:M10 family metallopeptidase C-terminal domain-containing protein n=1 Tax=Ciceribacter sp. sgz301302 TaxID=3342379 RepID=UPI0035B7D7DF
MTQTHIVTQAGKSFDALLHTERWHDSVVSFSFPTSPQHYMWKTKDMFFSFYTTYINVYAQPDYVNNFSPVTAAQTTAILRVLTDITHLTNVSFQQVEEFRYPFGPFGDVSGTLRFGRTANHQTASAFMPDEADHAGDVWFRTGKYDAPVLGSYEDITVLHEIGHAMGLRHGHEASNPYGALPYALDSSEFSLMTYRDFVGDDISSYSKETWGGPQSFMMLDIAALQYMYGADFSAGGAPFSGDTRYSFSPTTGEMFINGQGQGTPGGNRIFRTIWDGHGTDTYDLSNYSTDLDIDLRPGEWSTFDIRQLADLDGGPRSSGLARGNVANALLSNNDPRSLIENAYGGFGNDIIRGNQTANRLQGRDGNDVLLGLDGDDVLQGGWGDDTLRGGAGNDALFGHYDSDALYGEEGDDELWIDSPFQSAGEVYSGGSGIDTLHVSDSYDLRDAEIGSIEKIELDEVDSGPAVMVLDVAASSFGDGFWLNGVVSGNSLRQDILRVWMGQASGIDLSGLRLLDWSPDDRFDFVGDGDEEIVTGTFENDVFSMGGGRDVLNGGAGHDRLDGGADADTMAGGTGNDIYVVDHAGDRVIERKNEGTDTIEASVSFSLVGQAVENLTLTGTAAIDATGNSGRNTLRGNAAANTLDGGTQADVMRGGAGDDLYIVDHAGDRVFESRNEGTDLVRASVSFSLVGQAIENLTLTGRAAIDATGNSAANTLVGNAAANTLDGGIHADVMRGGAGNDIYIVDHAGDRVFENRNEGTDLVRASVRFSLVGQAIENLTLTGTAAVDATGNSAANRIVGNAAANRLDGLTGPDTLTGGDGEDVFAFSTAPGGSNVDRITDFSVIDDVIQLSRAVFRTLAAGPLATGWFKDVSKAALDADDRIVYDGLTGVLSYDVDGIGDTVARHFAVFDGRPTLTAADFVVV